MRKLFKVQETGLDPHFRYRGKNQTRIETLSDAAFALAIALTVLSTSVPRTFDDLWLSMKDVIPFGLCVILVMIIWNQHYLFFFRYGLQTTKIIVINTFLIFLILVYVYPLNFLFKILFDIYAALITGDHAIFSHLFTEVIRQEDTGTLMIIYGIGGSLIFLTLSMMYRYALSLKEELDLNDYELLATRIGLRTNLLLGAIPLLSVLIAALGIFGDSTFTIAGFAYMLYPPVMIVHGIRSRKATDKLLAMLNDPPDTAEEQTTAPDITIA